MALNKFIRTIKGKMNPDKKSLIDIAFSHLPIRSFIDLGGVWMADGAYTFYCLDRYKVDSAILVDLTFTEELIRKKKWYPNLKLIKGNFGEKVIIDQLSHVDAIFMFDILLRQVKPNWDEILEIYASLADCLLIFEPQYKADQTVRIMDRRDIPDIWQWGITNMDLITKMETLGFSLEYSKDCGRFGNLTNFDNYSFIFKKIKKE